MVRIYLTRGLLAGVVAGLLAVGFAKVLAEPQIAAAERFETAHATGAGGPGAKPVVARDVQDTVGLGTGVLVASAALGGLYALAFAFAHGRITRAPARLTALALAAAAFVSLVLVPFVKYPANPPAVGNPDTIGHRTAVYFALIVVAVLVTAAAVGLRHLLLGRLGGWNATLAAAGLFLAVIAVAYAVMPGVNEVPEAFPATVLWRFRLASLGTELVSWTALGLVFGALTERHETRLGHGAAPSALPGA